MEAKAELYTLPGRRRWVNSITRRVVALGGGAVIVAIALIFVYLLWVVAPIFGSASIHDGSSYRLEISDPAYVDVNESDEIGLVFDAAGDAASATGGSLAAAALLPEAADDSGADVCGSPATAAVRSRATRFPPARRSSSWRAPSPPSRA